ncbi:hypothetical protein [Brevibacillus laterosporus]|uniref:hypothetical protein n=1 Tax=Brevibacillus laterosporus TaxID=1465 RepID=UPI0015E21F07|nr:hypothetical protein [Brevibacillus laterosporus]
MKFLYYLCGIVVVTFILLNVIGLFHFSSSDKETVLFTTLIVTNLAIIFILTTKE